MSRAIVRYSFDGDSTSARNDLRAAFVDGGFVRTGTGSWEGVGALTDLMGTVGRVTAIVRRAASLDHLWVMVDDPS
jgi:hypothetical protein